MVVVLATVGEGNANVYLMNQVKPEFEYELPLSAPSFLKSGILYSTVQFQTADHHLSQFGSEIKSSFKYNSFSLTGQSYIRDSSKNAGKGQILGSSIICNSSDQKIFAADFDSKMMGNSCTINIGELIEGFQPEDFKYGAFINAFQMSFAGNEDHHLFKIELAAEICETSNLQNQICAKVNMKAFISDYGKNKDKNKADIPNNFISGFIIAFTNKTK